MSTYLCGCTELLIFHGTSTQINMLFSIWMKNRALNRRWVLIQALPQNLQDQFTYFLEGLSPQFNNISRGVQTFGFPGPHLWKKNCLGPHVQYANINDSWWAKKGACVIFIMFKEVYEFVLNSKSSWVACGLQGTGWMSLNIMNVDG